MSSFKLLIIAVLLVSSLASADTLVVPDDYPTIQGAIFASVNGDTVLVKPGTYVERIDFLGKAILVMSNDGPAKTIIDGYSAGSTVSFKTGEGPDSVLRGFTVTNGTGSVGLGGWTGGGGIFCSSASPTIALNIITGNKVTQMGGGFYAEFCGPKIDRCTIEENLSESYGGGMLLHMCVGTEVTRCTFAKNHSISRGAGLYNSSSETTVVGCRFMENSSEYRGGGIGNANSTLELHHCIFHGNTAAHLGGGMYSFTTDLTITNCTFHANIALLIDYGGGAMCNYSSAAKVTNCILWENSPDEIHVYSSGTTAVSHSCVQGGYLGPANIDVAPSFVDAAIGDLHIDYNSPCRDVGDNSAVTVFEDFEGDPINVSPGIVDMGADEYHNHLYYTGDATPGGQIEGKIVGLPGPGSMPLSIFVGSGVLQSPLQTPWGLFHLEAPWVLFTPLGEIPPDGIKRVPVTLPGSIPAPYDVPMQAMIGTYSTSFTNLCVLQVR